MKSKKVASALLAASVVATAVPAVAVQAAVTPAETAAKTALAKAEASLSQADWNAAVTAANKIADKNIKAWYLQKLFVVQRKVAAKNIRATVDNLKTTGKVLDTTAQANLAKTFESEATKVNSFAGLNAGLKNEILNVYFEEVKRVNAVNVVEAKAVAGTLTEAELAAEKAAAAKLVNTALRTELTTKLNAVKITYEVKVDAVSAVAANKMEVKFNQKVDTAKVSFDVARGTIKTNVKSITWNDAKTVATLESFTAYPAGDYTVTVKGLEKELTGTVKFEAQKVAKVEVLGDVAVLTGVVGTATTAEVSFKVTDQYGVDATSTFGSALTLSTTADGSTPIAISGTSANVLQLSWASAPTKDSIVVVTLVDPTTGVVGTKTLKVATQSTASAIKLSALKNKDNKVLRTNTTLTTDIFAFDVDAVDQYGNAVKSATQLGSDYLVVLPTGLTTTWVAGTSTTPAQLKVTGVPSTAGTYTVTIVSKATGASTVATVVVEKAIALESLTLAAPSDLYILGESVYIPFTAYDQYGQALTKFSDITGVVLSTTNTTKYPITLEKNPVDGTARIKLSTSTSTPGNAAAANDMVVITSVANGKSSTITLKLNAAAAPTRIASISSDVAKKMVVGATSTIAHTDFVVKDQYERTMDLPAGYNVKLTSSNTANVTVSGNVTTLASRFLTGVAAGSATITATLNNGTADVANSSLEFVAETVAKTAVTNFEIAVPEKVYVNAAAYGTTDEQDAYAADIKVYGLTAAGDRVALATTDLVNLSSTNSKVDLASVAGKIYANGALASGVDEEAATIVAVVKGANDVVTTVTKNIKLSDAAKVGGDVAVKAVKADYVTFADNIAVMTIAKVTAMNGKIMSSHDQYAATPATASVYFEIKDQYGVASAAVKPAYYTISAKNAAGTAYTTEYAINPSTGAFGVVSHTPVSGDEITVTAITSTGKVATVKIIVQ